MRWDVAACALVGLVGVDTIAMGTSVSAPVAVSVNVVRSCSVVSGTNAGLVMMACSTGVRPVTIARDRFRSELRVLAGANPRFTVGYPTRQNGAANRPFVVTLNF